MEITLPVNGLLNGKESLCPLMIPATKREGGKKLPKLFTTLHMLPSRKVTVLYITSWRSKPFFDIFSQVNLVF